MQDILKKLAQTLQSTNPKMAEEILCLAGRYDKVNESPPEIQPAYKYIMYLKLMHNLDDKTFHHMKRKYLNTSQDIQEECRQELNKILNQDALRTGISSAEIYKTFHEKLKRVPQSLIQGS